MSPAALEILAYARSLVDAKRSTDPSFKFTARFNPDAAERFLKTIVTQTVIGRMQEEMAPYNHELVRLMSLRTHLDDFEPPPEIRSAMDQIREKWLAIHREITGTP